VPNFWGPTLLLLAFFTYQFFLSCQYQFDIVVEQLRSRQRHRLLSEQDSLTGLANRRRFERTLESLCDANAPFAILYIDLDRFKRVNDTFGHATGDTLLIQAAERLRGTLRPTDLLARLGGDEFAILQVPFLDADSAQAVARRINQVIAEPFLIADKSISIGASVGIRLAPGTRCDPDALLSTADHALYSVKRTGGGGFALAEA
jgi:diguanylate cyclase (GGDEF)-like protein